MVYKFPTKRSISPKPKNPFAKLRPLENPCEVWQSPDGTWEYRILKKNQVNIIKKPVKKIDWQVYVGERGNIYLRGNQGDIFRTRLSKLPKRFELREV